MFAYLRYFAVVSLILIVIGATLVGQMFKSMSGEDLRTLTDKTNHTLTQAYVNAVWKQHYPRLYAEFRSDSRAFFEEMPIIRMNVYTRQGKPLYSSTGAQITVDEDDKSEQQALYTNALSGTSGTRILEEASYFLSSGEQAMGTLVQTVTPISSDQFPDILSTPGQPTSSRVEGVIELYFDITPQWDRLNMLSNITSITIVLIFIVVIAILIYISRKAELIIAKQHEVNLELTAAASSAEAENREKSQFLANISHELRTPLNAIIGFSEIIKTDQSQEQNPVHSDYIRDIHSSGVHLLSLINDILDYSKAEAGKLELELSEIDATKLIKNSMRLVIPRAEEANVTLLEDLPAERIIMHTDGKKLKQVLLNLLSNAVKFTNAGGQVRVTAWNNVIDKSVCLEVSDTGIGIAPKDISRVMTPFGQVDSTLARKYEGTGLGLPLSKKFVETMGGTFTITSEVNKGTTITIKLPMSAPTESAKHGSEAVEETIIDDTDESNTPPAEPAAAQPNESATTITETSPSLAQPGINLDMPQAPTPPAPAENAAPIFEDAATFETTPHAETPAATPTTSPEAPIEPTVHYTLDTSLTESVETPAQAPEPVAPPAQTATDETPAEAAPAPPPPLTADPAEPAPTAPPETPAPASVATPPPAQTGIPTIEFSTPPAQEGVAPTPPDSVSQEKQTNEDVSAPAKLEFSEFAAKPKDDDTGF